MYICVYVFIYIYVYIMFKYRECLDIMVHNKHCVLCGSMLME